MSETVSEKLEFIMSEKSSTSPWSNINAEVEAVTIGAELCNSFPYTQPHMAAFLFMQ
jgi:hypothetical protein